MRSPNSGDSNLESDPPRAATGFICRGIIPSELEIAKRVIEQGFSPSSTPEPQKFTQFLELEPPCSLEHIRVAEVGGKIVAGCILIPFTLQIGGMSFLVGGFTGVATLPGYRHRGIALSLVNDALSFLRNSGYQIAVLKAGVPALYAKAGFVLSFTGNFGCDVPQGRKPSATRNVPDRELVFDTWKPSEIQHNRVMDAIFEVNSQSAALCSRQFRVIRFRNRFAKMLVFHEHAVFTVSRRSDGQILAYGSYSDGEYPGELRVIEFFSLVEDTEIYSFGLQSLLQATEMPLEQLKVCFQPTQSALRAVLSSWRGVEWHSPISKHMAKILNPTEILQQFLPIFNSRLQEAAELPTIQLDISVIGNGEHSQSLRIENNYAVLPHKADAGEDSYAQIHLTLSNEDFTQLIFGTTDPGDILGDLPIWKEPKLPDLLRTLFPPLNPNWPPEVPY